MPVPDGPTLRADLWLPRQAPPRPAPTLLVASPYGRGPLLGALRTSLRERGFQVLLAQLTSPLALEPEQDKRRGANPPRQLREQVLALLAWAAQQPWCNGPLAMSGPSYLGYAQWAVADAVPPAVAALVPQMTSSRLPMALKRDRILALDTVRRWVAMTEALLRGSPQPLVHLLTTRVRADNTATPAEDDQRLFGRRVPVFRALVRHDAHDDEFWAPWDFSGSLPDVQVPVSLVAGWYDPFLPDQVRDYETLVRAGRSPRLTIGPWTHLSLRGVAAGIRETLGWAGGHCGVTPQEQRAPVRLYVLGAGCWRDFDAWPPARARDHRWYLWQAGALSPQPPDLAHPPSRFSSIPTGPLRRSAAPCCMTVAPARTAVWRGATTF